MASSPTSRTRRSVRHCVGVSGPVGSALRLSRCCRASLPPVFAAGIVSTLVVFRNNVSHGRYFEARSLLSAVKTGLCLAATSLVSCSSDSVAENTDSRSSARGNTFSGDPATLVGRRGEFFKLTKSILHLLQVSTIVGSTRLSADRAESPVSHPHSLFRATTSFAAGILGTHAHGLGKQGCSGTRARWPALAVLRWGQLLGRGRVAIHGFPCGTVGARRCVTPSSRMFEM